VAQKDQELRPVMTRIPERLRRRLEREAKWHRRSMNAEIVHRLQESFDGPDYAGAIASDVASEIGSELSDVQGSLDQIQSQIRAILSHLRLPDPVEEAKARREEARKAARERAEAAKRPDAGPPMGVLFGQRADKPEDESN
jgi:Arc-like DNA binding domain